jgi:SAM-dependent methyltransferase/uncharacterized protein YbaR (Trm112 family)
MYPWAAHRYRCPLSGAPLQLRAFDQETTPLTGEQRGRIEELGLPVAEFERRVRMGVLVEPEARRFYPILNFVPVLLDFDNAVYDHFEERCAAYSGAWKRLRRPDGMPRPGEAITQRNFTVEWEAVYNDQLTFTYTHEEREEFIRMELEWPRERMPEPEFETLDVGCGFGAEAHIMQRITQTPVFAIDLNLSLLESHAHFPPNPFVQLAIASAFAPPFEQASFDLVYSHGVLMATIDTRKAFESILRFMKPDGEIYIWVYALEDAQRGNLRRKLAYLIELSARPRIAKLPAPLQKAVIMALAAHHYRWYHKRGLKREHWSFRNSIHSMRDRWTPVYATRHSFHEVLGWFLANGLGEYRLPDPLRYREVLKRNLIGVGIRGRKSDPDRGAASRERELTASPSR